MRRKYWWIFLAVLCVVLGFSVSINTSQRGRVVDSAGKPIANAFVIYTYSAGTRSIWPFTYYDGPYMMRTDQDGRFATPFKMRLRFPFVNLNTPVQTEVSVYTPELHSFCELSFAKPDTDSYCYKAKEDAGARMFTLRDLHSDDAARYRTLWMLIYARGAVVKSPSEDRHKLVAAARNEYDQFLSDYGSTVPDSHSLMMPVTDWTKDDPTGRPWSFYLQTVPYYGVPMEKALLQLETESVAWKGE